MTEKIIYLGEDKTVIEELRKKYFVQKFNNPLLASRTILKAGVTYAIFCDLEMKGVNAFHFFKEIYQTIYFRGIPFIILTNEKVDKELIKKGLSYKIDDIIQKPIDINKIDRRLKFLKKFKSKKIAYSGLDNKDELKIPLWKRIFDIIFASLAIIFLSPIFIIVIIALKLESKGPVFYSSKRVGMGYKIFDFYKFRSMYVDADKRLKEVAHLNQYNDGLDETKKEDVLKQEPNLNTETVLISDNEVIPESEFLLKQKDKKEKAFVKIKNDPRITKVGRFIRKTSIDELPQLFNVLKGDMSIVGNRPIPLYEAEVLTSDAYSKRFLAPAGITGLWQVTKRGKSDMSNEERKQLDNTYAENYSFWGDIKLLLKTVTALMQTEDV